ncbi:MAG: hypothetical protein IPI04_04275 [Ignavibacteria bacterium]|nr:hypothetical protein [Ignavibacteria bacterium]
MDAGVYSVNFKSEDKIVAGKLTYKLEVKGISGIKNVLAEIVIVNINSEKSNE